ncbi:efflux RND transporter permease subunit [Alkalimarinus coralli]|uniref:efflux RND transporter permease subunit n=1 Tax=Alkalimarinus coralli TaxID=2935863 RepID=UPI00202B6CED|nr:efflux RND transporter permease subunit [Alkalimarinus coralli]
MKHPVDELVRSTLTGAAPLFIFVISLVMGSLALTFMPREEEPQIVVPMVDVLVDVPGLSAKQVERQVTTPLEKLLAQIPGVENVYSSSMTGKSAVTLRFFVGQDREKSILNTYNKLYSNQGDIPGVVKNWQVKPIEVDDVPIMVLALWSRDSSLYSDYELRRVAEDVSTFLQGIPSTSEVKVVGGRPRNIRVLIKPESLAARKTTPIDIVSAIEASNVLQSAGLWVYNNRSIVLESGDVVATAEELENLVVNVIDSTPILLKDVADIVDGPAEADGYTWIDFAPAHVHFEAAHSGFPMVSISVAKQQGSNAVQVASDVHQAIADLKSTLLPAEIDIEVMRDYGDTANDKVNNLVSSLGFAVATVVIFIGIFLGWRSALVVGLAVPICYGITLALDMAFGYTINRVTLFALILSLGLLVDDPITGVDNISRFMKTGEGDIKSRIVAAVSEIRSPLLMSTLTIILAFVPLAFITGMMGPYMAPMAFNVPVSVLASTLVAFFVTPWLASKFLSTSSADTAPPVAADKPDSVLLKGYRWCVMPLLNSRRKAKWALWLVLVLFILAALLPVLRMVPLKLLPFDNKNEIQILIDMPESSSLESTADMARRVSAQVSRVSEVSAIAAYVGHSSPMDFNGMVRRYYQRSAPNLADLRLTLVDKTEREHQSHDVVLRLRALLAPLIENDVQIKVVEVPPGPPVLSTIVAEIYGDTLTAYDTQKTAAIALMQRLQREPFVVDVDSTVEVPRQRLRFIADKQKAALSGVSTDDISNTLAMANNGLLAGFLGQPMDASPLPIVLRLDPQERSSLTDFERLQVRGRSGVVQSSTAQGLKIAPQPLVPIGELGQFEPGNADEVIFRKDLKPVVYVTAELSGRTPAEVIADVNADQSFAKQATDFADQSLPTSDWQQRSYLTSGAGDLWTIPEGTDISWRGEGEWKITVDVFRDMGLAFAFALVAIFFVLRAQTASSALSLIIMSAIPLTVIGIMPGFWLLNQFGEREIAGAPEPVLFTATAMIGMIALAGIVVRNSLILIEYISQARANGLPMKEALILAVSIRIRPILLTAGTTMLGNLVIILDPVFSGLALAIIFGIVASTVFTLLVVPVVYLLVFDKPVKKEGELLYARK